MLRSSFQQLIEEKQWWQAQEKVVVGVSSGVDSMVLLDLLLTLPKNLRPDIIVAHINHQLREASYEEESFLKLLCQKEKLTFHSTKWAEGLSLTSQVELQAREFRYRFFEDVLKSENSSILLTAHHQDDQVETMLMRLVSGNRLKSLVGIEEVRHFSTGYLIRPLLDTTKKELYDYATEFKLTFYEDETNQENTYLRNRIRNQWLPVLEEENPQFKKQLLLLQKELSLTNEFVDNQIAIPFKQVVKLTEDSIYLNQSHFLAYSKSEQYLLLNKLVEEAQKKLNLVISKQQQEALHQLMLSHKPHQALTLKEGWQVTRSYESVRISKEEASQNKSTIFSLSLNEGIFLSDSEWLGCYENGEERLPNEVKTWVKKEIVFYEASEAPFVIRKKQEGDRLLINKQGQSKKISRYFIDEKVPVEKREKSWVVEDSNGHIKWLLPFRESYLSIRDETDKIHYKLVYFYRKDK